MFITSGLYRHHKLLSPKGSQTRPTSTRVREALFNICQPVINHARFLDVFAGSGAMGLEALSRGASFSTFIESHRHASACITQNIANLGVKTQTQLLQGDVFSMLTWLEKKEIQFDIIYVDPPYRTLVPGSHIFYSQQVIEWMDTHSLLAPEGLLFVEEDCKYEPKIEGLTSLRLKNTRRLGSAALQQYQKILS